MTCEGQEPSNYYVLFLHGNIQSIIEMYFIKDSWSKLCFSALRGKLLKNVTPKNFSFHFGVFSRKSVHF